MSTQTIDRGEWQAYFDKVSRSLLSSTVDVEVNSMELGAQQQFSGLQLVGLSYDPHDDAFSIITEHQEHRIIHPKFIAVNIDGDHLQAVEIVDSEDRRHIARFMESLSLPPSVGEANPLQ